MAGNSLTSTWRANFRPQVGYVRYRWDDLSINLVAGECCELTLEFDGSHFTDDSESAIALHCVSDSLGHDIGFSPPETQLVDLVSDPHTFSSVTWIISTGHAQHGTSWIYFSMPQYPGMPDSPRIPIKIFNDFVIMSLTTPDPMIVVGLPSSADIKVVDRVTGLAMSKVSIEWKFGGQTLPTTQTKDDGTSSILFTPEENEVGEQTLTARVQSGSEELLTFMVARREVKELDIVPSEVMLGSNVTVKAHVFPSIQGKEVLLSYTGEQDLRAYTNFESVATGVFWARQVPTDHFAMISATINQGHAGAMTRVRKVWVIDPAAVFPEFWIGNSAIPSPDLAHSISPNTDTEVSIRVEYGDFGKEFAMFCDQSVISIDPPPGEFRKYPGLRLRWKINSQAPTGTRIAIVVASKDKSVVGRLNLLVT